MRFKPVNIMRGEGPVSVVGVCFVAPDLCSICPAGGLSSGKLSDGCVVPDSSCQDVHSWGLGTGTEAEVWD